MQAGGTITRTTATALAGAGLLAARGLARRRRPPHADGQVALITGASRGLGFAMAQELAAAGARLAICARDGEHLEGAAEELARDGTEVFAQTCDVGDDEQVDRFVDGVLSRFGRVDVLINNAGVIAVGPERHQTLADYREAMDVMFWGVVHPTLRVLPHFREHGAGRIVTITSIGGKISPPRLLPYNCAKHAAVGFTEGLRAELAPEGISVTTVVPGLMRTGSHRNALFKGRQSAEYSWFALGATNPLTAMDARKAARTIVAAALRGDPEVILSLPAKLAVRANGIAPALTSRALSVANRLLPAPGEAADPDNAGAERAPGRDRETAMTRSPLTALGRRPVEELRQHKGDR